MAYTAITVYGQKPEAKLFDEAGGAGIHIHLDPNCYFALDAEEAQALGLELLKLAAVAAAKQPAPASQITAEPPSDMAVAA